MLASNSAFRKAEAIFPERSDIREALEALRCLENKLDTQGFIFNARAFLYPAPIRAEDPPALPNYAAAEFALQLALRLDINNKEARDLLRVASGIRAVSIDTDGVPAEVFAKRIIDGHGQQLPKNDKDFGIYIGLTPFSGVELVQGLGLYVLTFRRGDLPVQQATVLVSREARDEDLQIKIPLSADEENMALIGAGVVSSVNLVKVPRFAIDRFEYPNRAGGMPTTGFSLVEAKKLCELQGKKLCTSDQWLRACIGDHDRKFPYGMNYISGTCAAGFDGDTQKRPLISGLFFRCRTAEGVYDMSGNVSEWTQTDQQEKAYGGDWTSSVRVPDLTIDCQAHSLPGEVNSDRLGFRCCKNK